MRGIKEVKKELSLVMTEKERETLSLLVTEIYDVFGEDFGLSGKELTFEDFAELIEEGNLDMPYFSMTIVEVKD